MIPKRSFEEDCFSGAEKFFLSPHKDKHTVLESAHTLSERDLKRDTYRFWTLDGHCRVREEQRHRENADGDLPALHSHPSPAPRHEEETEGAH